jgi:hypothetical protein
VIVASATFVVAFLVAALLRLHVPAPLTDVALGTVQHVQRILDRLPLYAVPSAQFVPLSYPPLYYYVSAGMATLTGPGYVPLRLVSIASTLIVFGLLGTWARKETGSWWSAVVAAGMFAATYRMTAAWFDVERVDALCLALLVAALYSLRFSTREILGPVSAGALIVSSALTKQTSWIVALVIAGYLILTDRRRGLIFGSAVAAGAAVSTLWFTLTEGRGYVFFVFGLGTHSFGGTAGAAGWLGATYAFAVHDVVGVLPVALLLPAMWLVAPVRARSRVTAESARFYAAVWCGVAAAALASRLIQESGADALLPVYAWTVLLCGVAAHELIRMARQDGLAGARELVSAVCLVQFVALAYVPWHLVPPFTDAAGDDVLIIDRTAAGARVTRTTLAWPEAQRVPHFAMSAAEDLLEFAPPATARAFADNLERSLCGATAGRPVVVSARFFDPQWQTTMQPYLAPPLQSSIDAALAACSRPVAHSAP